MVRDYIRHSHPSYLITFHFSVLLSSTDRPPSSAVSKFDGYATRSSWTSVPECFPQAKTCSNASSKAPARTPHKLYHDVTLDLANVCTPSLAVHPAIDEARA